MARRTFVGSTVGALIAASTLFVTPARAADILIVPIGSTGDCQTTFGFGFCYLYDGKITATVVGGTQVQAVNPITARVGDTISIPNPTSHNLIFCTAGTFVPNDFSPPDGWVCGNPIAKLGTSGPWPENPAASTPGAPEKIGYDFGTSRPYSTTLTSVGEFYFWCGIGSHSMMGQYGKLIVLEALPTTTTTTTPPTTTVPPTTSSTPPTTTPVTTSTIARPPSLSVKKAGGRVTATGRATPGARVTLQKLVGSRWVSVASSTVGRSGSYTVRARGESKPTSYRVKVGTATSPSRRVT